MNEFSTESPIAYTPVPIFLPDSAIPKQAPVSKENLLSGIDQDQPHGVTLSDSRITVDGDIESSIALSSQSSVDHRLDNSRVWGTDFARITMRQAIELADRIVQQGRPQYFITANLNYLMLASQNARLQEINRQCSCILADGIPIVLRSRLGPSPLPERVAGADMIVNLAKLSAEKGYRIFFLGGASGVAEAAADRLRHQFPALQIAGTFCPPFRKLDSIEESQMIELIRSSRPDILLVAFGQPKGEIWIADHLKDLNIPLSIQLGASFDFLAGTARRAPRVWQALGCEWLYRALSDPKRLVPRYWKNFLFLAQLLSLDVAEYCSVKWGTLTQRVLQRSS